MPSNIDLSKIKKEHLILICAVLIGLIAFFAYKNVFQPLLGKIKNVSLQIEQKKTSIQKAKISPDALKELEDELEQIKTQLDSYQKRLKSQADVPQILKEINQIAERLKIKIVSVSPLKSEETALPGGEALLLQIPIRITLGCGYHQLGIFINQIENSPNFMQISELKINADSANIWAHQAELVITSYRLVSQ